VITVSDKSQAAVAALVDLARRGGDAPVPILEVADGAGIQLHVCEQLFAAMKRTGILRSQRGVRGGYAFGRPPRDVTVLDVVESVDGPLRPGPPPAAQSASEVLFREAQERLADLLAGVTVADVLEHESRLAGALMFHI
jgi:Rrf2 family cysteine metabolism transcriptional repressor